MAKSYGALTVLRNVDIKIGPGQVLALLGPNGAGKTTFVSIVAGLRRPDAGDVRVLGVDAVRRPSSARRFLGLAPQDLGIYPSVTVGDNLRFFGKLAGLRGHRLLEAVRWVADRLGLIHLLDRPARTLSGGEKRKLHVGGGLVRRPPLLLLDEPTSGTDVATRAALLGLVRDVAAQGTAVCYSTQNLRDVESLDASVVILDRGAIVAQGSVAGLAAAHGTSVLEMTFDGPPPHVGAAALADARVETVGWTLRFSATDPGRTMAALLADMGPDAARLRSVDVIRPSLESAFLALTGRRYEESAEGDRGALAPT